MEEKHPLANIAIDSSPPRRVQLKQKTRRAKQHRCTSVVCVLENPSSDSNIGSVMRSVEAFGMGRMYIISSVYQTLERDETGRYVLLKGGQQANAETLRKSSAFIKWMYCRVFPTAEACLAHLDKKEVTSFATSPHVKGHVNQNLCEVKWSSDKAVAIWLGNERIER